jgi:hypothetical protein
LSRLWIDIGQAYLTSKGFTGETHHHFAAKDGMQFPLQGLKFE